MDRVWKWRLHKKKGSVIMFKKLLQELITSGSDSSIMLSRNIKASINFILHLSNLHHFSICEVHQIFMRSPSKLANQSINNISPNDSVLAWCSMTANYIAMPHFPIPLYIIPHPHLFAPVVVLRSVVWLIMNTPCKNIHINGAYILPKQSKYICNTNKPVIKAELRTLTSLIPVAWDYIGGARNSENHDLEKEGLSQAGM